jgi:hypothetical protein
MGERRRRRRELDHHVRDGEQRVDVRAGRQADRLEPRELAEIPAEGVMPLVLDAPSDDELPDPPKLPR